MSATSSGEIRYRGSSGVSYFGRFETGRGADIIGRDFASKMAGWIRPTDRVFEYGAGSGVNLLGLTAVERAGYDVSEFAREHCRAAGLRMFDTLDEVPRGRWDVVICHHVLEHCTEPAEVLTLLRDLLGRNGRLLLTVPLEGHERRLRPLRPVEEAQLPDSKLQRIGIAVVRRITHQQLDQDYHLYCWNPSTLRNLLALAGFSLNSIWVRTSARRDIFAPIANYSWPAFRAFTYGLGVLLRRREINCVANVGSPETNDGR